MKKTVLIVIAAGLLAIPNSNAFEQAKENVTESITFSEKVEISTFCKAIMKGDIATVKRLIELGEDVNKKSLGMTPAIFAARYNKAEILKVLIKHGADLSLRSDKGYTIKKHAELSNATEVLEVLASAS